MRNLKQELLSNNKWLIEISIFKVKVKTSYDTLMLCFFIILLIGPLGVVRQTWFKIMESCFFAKVE